jgi:hypothetical protein
MLHQAAPINLHHTPAFFHWGVIQISVANFIVICIMLALFILAILLPFPKGRRRR